MIETIRQMWATIEKALAQQNKEAPELFLTHTTTATRLCLIAVLLFAVVLLGQFIWAIYQKNKRNSLWLGITLLLTVLAAGWVYFPASIMPQTTSVQSVQLLTRVPGKAEKEVPLTAEQQTQLLQLLSDTKCTRSFDAELPYGSYGQTFRIFLQTENGEICILATPDSGCRYTVPEQALIYPISGYRNFYQALGTFAPT